MPNEKTIQVHTHRIEPGAECNPEKLCKPMEQASRRGWFCVPPKMPLGRNGEFKCFVSVGDTELGYLSVFKFCPFCGVDLESFPDYAQFNEGEPVTNSFDTKTGEVTQP